MDRECLVCGAWHSHAHHALPKSVWPEHRHNRANLILLCPSCHMDWHAGRRPVYRESLHATTRHLLALSAPSEWLDKWYPQRPSVTPF
jgi:5-methylcytosine-specific restriction endonuclease McrA